MLLNVKVIDQRSRSLIKGQGERESINLAGSLQGDTLHCIGFGLHDCINLCTNKIKHLFYKLFNSSLLSMTISLYRYTNFPSQFNVIH